MSDVEAERGRSVNFDPYTGDVTTIGYTSITISLTHEGEVLATGANTVELAANVKAALTEARAQGAAEERERLAKLADARKIAWREDGRPGLEGVWHNFAEWIRSQKDQHHDQ